jgi:hypothetical protein
MQVVVSAQLICTGMLRLMGYCVRYRPQADVKTKSMGEKAKHFCNALQQDDPPSTVDSISLATACRA